MPLFAMGLCPYLLPLSYLLWGCAPICSHAPICYGSVPLFALQANFPRPAIWSYLGTFVYKPRLLFKFTRLTFLKKCYRPTISRPAIWSYLGTFVYKPRLLFKFTRLTFPKQCCKPTLSMPALLGLAWLGLA